MVALFLSAMMGFLPAKGALLGFRLTSFSHLPSQFMLQYTPPQARFSFDIGIDYTFAKSSGETGETRVSRNALSLGITFLRLLGTHSLGNGDVSLSGLYGLRPGISYTSSKTSETSEGSSSQREEKIFSLGATIKTGAEAAFSLFGLDARLQLLVNALTLERISYELSGTSGGNTVHQSGSTLQIHGLNLATGVLEIWLLFRI